jgi:hypothetical protein
MRTMSLLRWALVGVTAWLVFAPAPSQALTCGLQSAQPICAGPVLPSDATRVAERRGSTTSDGPGSPYTDARKKKPQQKKQKDPVDSANNRFICESNCPYPKSDARQEACIQKCLDRYRARRR